ncbi:MAG TPA: ABC transporter ATP-binding protein [Ilumatobacteraceae bacterium]
MSAGTPVDGQPVLETIRLCVSYGGVGALGDVDLNVSAGEMVGLIGPNGAGKTTAIDTLSGFVRPQSGTVRLDGRDITAMPPHRRARLGLGRTFQSIESFEPLSVEDNLRVAVAPARRRTPLDIDQRVAAILAQLDLAEVASAFPAELSYGQQKLAGLATALIREPRVLLLDEPAAGLDGGSVEILAQQLRRVRHSGVGVLLVDHDMDVIFGLCDRVYVLDFGRLIAVGTPDVVRHDPRVTAAYLGGPAPAGPVPA